MRVRNWRSRLGEPEPKTRAGEILLSRNHIPLLHGLYDRPNGIAISHRDWVQAALPYARQINSPSWGLLRGLHSVHPSWVARQPSGSRIICGLTERGIAILERKLPAYVRYYGPYEGLAAMRRPR